MYIFVTHLLYLPRDLRISHLLGGVCISFLWISLPVLFYIYFSIYFSAAWQRGVQFTLSSSEKTSIIFAQRTTRVPHSAF